MSILFNLFLGPTIDKVVRETIDQRMEQVVDEAVRNSPIVQFIKTMQMQMLGCNPNMDPREAWNAAVEALKAFLEDEGCEFGDPDYCWDRDAAIEVIHEYEIHHWESAP